MGGVDGVVNSVVKQNKPYTYAVFPTTKWSLVVRAADIHISVKRAALGELLENYMPALRSHLVYRKRVDPGLVDDLIQEFIQSQILERELIAKVEKTKGKLRTFLLTALDRYVSKYFRDRSAQKRGPRLKVDVDALPEPATPSDKAVGVEQIFDIEWARSVLDQAIHRTLLKCQSSGRQDVWNVFECRLLGPILHGVPPAPYEEIINRLGLKSPIQAANLLVTGKRIFERMLRGVVLEYAADEDQVDEEIMDLKKILSQSGCGQVPADTPQDSPGGASEGPLL